MNEQQILELLKILGIPLVKWILEALKKRIHIPAEKRDTWLPIVAALLGAIGQTILVGAAPGSDLSLTTPLVGAGYGALASSGYKVFHRSGK